MKNAKKILENHLEKVFNGNDEQVEKFLDREKEQLKNKGYILN